MMDVMMVKKLEKFMQANELVGKMGPFKWKDEIGVPYTTLVLGLPKAEGSLPSPEMLRPQIDPVFFREFFENLLAWLNGRKQIVWRELPCILESDLGYTVWCRLSARP